MSYNIESIKETLKKRLTEEHYEHSVRTAGAAVSMAKTFGIDQEKAYLAGLLHDYAKSMSPEELVAKSEELGLPINAVERAYPYLLHSKLGARLVELDLSIKDDEIVSAIEHHTLGATSMTQLDKVIYVADMIEPGRPYQGLDMLRSLALEDLDEVFMEAYVHVMSYLVRARKLIHPLTVEVWNKLVSS